MSIVVDPAQEAEASASVDSLEQDIVENKPEPSIPDKYKGKSAEELVSILQDQESYIGKQSNEIGQLRKTVNNAINAQAPKQEPKAPAVDVDSLLDNPEQAVNAVLESNPRLNAVEQKLMQQELNAAKSSFEAKHPKWQETVNTQEFRNFVGETPVRQEMFKAADQNYNYQVADELFTTFEQLQAAKTNAHQEQRTAQRNSDLKAATTETGVSAPSRGKTYKRGDLRELRRNDPEKWEANWPDIYRAYQEGRVVD